MSRPSLTGAWQSTVVLAAALCFATTAVVPAYADDAEPPLPAPPLADSPATTSSDTPPELLAVPRAGSPASYLADAPEPLPSGTPAPSAGARSLSVAETGSISGTITGLVGSCTRCSGVTTTRTTWPSADA
jgi:hypothetical protein